MSEPMVDAAAQTIRCTACKDEIPMPLGVMDWVLSVLKAFGNAHKYCKTGGEGGLTTLAGIKVERKP